MSRKWWLLWLLGGLFLSLGAAQNDAPFTLDRYDATVQLEEGGNLRVEASLTYHFVGGPFTEVSWDLPTGYTDGITDISAAMDGRTLPAGTSPGQVEINGRDPIHITWHFRPTASGVHTFTLTYQVLGAIWQEEMGDVLQWQALPPAFPGVFSQVTFIWPPDTYVWNAETDPFGHGTFGYVQDGLVWTRQGPGSGEPVIITLNIEPGRLVSNPPDWQIRLIARDRYLQRQWQAAAAGVLIVGLVTLALFGRPKLRRSYGLNTSVNEPPADLPPALAGLVRVRSADPHWAIPLGTLFDLANRNVLAFEEIGQTNKFGRRDFVIRQVASPLDLHPHEEGLLRLLFSDKFGRHQEVKVSELREVVRLPRWKRYAERFPTELHEAGFLNVERSKAKVRLQNVVRVWTYLFQAFFILLVILPLQLRDFIPPLSHGPLYVAQSALLVMLIGNAVISRHSVLLEAGERAAAEWQAFYHYVREVVRGQVAIDQPGLFEQYLPYAAAFGLLTSWVNRFKKKDWTHVPAYFHARSADDGERKAAFAAFTSALVASGGAAIPRGSRYSRPR